MSQEHKKEIASLLKQVMPKSWKYSLAVRNHSSIVLTIRSAPVDLVTPFTTHFVEPQTHVDVNPYVCLERLEGQPELQEIFSKILDCLNHKNHDRSDSQTDYFDVGHYVDIHIGKWNKPFEIK